MNNLNTNTAEMTNILSTHNVKDTGDRLVSILTEKGLNVVARIDHAHGAQSVGEELRPTQLILFGNPKMGTLLMQSQQTIAIDLPQKVLVWEDENAQVWLSYNNPDYLAKRHGISDCGETLSKVSNSLKEITKNASE